MGDRDGTAPTFVTSPASLSDSGSLLVYAVADDPYDSGGEEDLAGSEKVCEDVRAVPWPKAGEETAVGLARFALPS